ncbi:MAG TPA: PaaI family thioesterase [Dehalococcoidia bacterium]|nr:PaaI family thioesterase [Dehalococcoidia bacterium]
MDQPADYRALWDSWESIPFWHHLGIRVEAMDDGYIRLRLAVVPEVRNRRNGSVHGGVLAALVDAAAGGAILSATRMQPDYAGQNTAELNVSFLAPASGHGDLVAEGRLIRCGRVLAVAEVELRADERLLAKGRATYVVRRRDRQGT